MDELYRSVNESVNESVNDNIYINDNEYDTDDEYLQNDVPPLHVNDDFRVKVLDVKHSLYNNIVLSPELGTKEAQDSKVLNEYLDKINRVYILSLDAQLKSTSLSNNIDDELKVFPSDSRDSIKDVLVWITDYFSKNNIPDTIPYTDYIYKSFHEYQFIQNNSFE